MEHDARDSVQAERQVAEASAHQSPHQADSSMLGAGLGAATLQLGAGLVRRKILRRLARRKGGDDGVLPGAGESVEAANRSSGSPLPATVQRKFEQSLGADLSAVRVHTSGASEKAAESVSARAYTLGSDIHFGRGEYDPDSRQGQELLAHEVAHTVQQGASGVSRKVQFKLDVSSPGDAAEVEADTAAAAMVDGRPATLGAAPALDALHRSPVRTNGGSFDTSPYTATNIGSGVGKTVGAHAHITFTPNDLVEAPTIGLIQSVKTMKSTSAGGPVNTPSLIPSPSFNTQLSLTSAEGDQGRAIDQGDGAHGPNTNPFYAVENPAGRQSATLTDVAPVAAAGYGDHGHRTRKADGSFDVKKASLDDSPHRQITFAGQQYEQEFEVTALVADGPMANTYLGSVAWGWKSDAAGTAALDPNPIRMVQAGAPSSHFMEAARKWNNATLTDSSGTAHATVDIPLTATDSGTIAAESRTTADLIARMTQVQAELGRLAAGVDRANKEFEERALETELRRRQAIVEVTATQGASGMSGATQGYVLVRGGGRSAQSALLPLGGGAPVRFPVALGSLVPITGALTVDVVAGNASGAAVASVAWNAPYAPASATGQQGGTTYAVRVHFDR